MRLHGSGPIARLWSRYPLFVALFLLAFAGKLAGYVPWSWSWVTAPLWLPWLGLALLLSTVSAVYLVFDRLC